MVACRLSLACALGLAGAGVALAAPLNLSPVGNPIPGVGPVGLTVANTRGGTFILIADHQGNRLRSYGIDRGSGALTPAATVPTGDGPSALAVSRGGRFVVASNLRSNDLQSFSIDPLTGALALVASAPSGGSGPVSVEISDDGFVLVANKDSDQLGVLSIDPLTGALTNVGSQTVGSGPAVVKASGRHVLVGHAISQDVHLLHLDRYGNLLPLDSQTVGARVSAMTLGPGGVAAVGTYPNGDVHAFVAGQRRLRSLGTWSTGGDLTALELSARGVLFGAGITPARVAGFDLTRHGLRQAGSLAMTGLSSRTLTTVRGRGGATFVVVNEYNNNQTVVLQAR